MQFFDNGSLFTVTVLRREVEAFKRQWPCSGLPDRAITFQFDKRNGDLVDVRPDDLNGDGVKGLLEDAREYGYKKLK